MMFDFLQETNHEQHSRHGELVSELNLINQFQQPHQNAVKQSDRLKKNSKFSKKINKPKLEEIMVEEEQTPAIIDQSIPQLLEMDALNQKFKLNHNAKNAIKEKLQEIQQQVYISETTTNNIDYLNAINQKSRVHQKPALRQEIKETIARAERKIDKDIQSGKKQYNIQKRQIPKNKEELNELNRMDQYKMIKMREGYVKNNVIQLKQQLDDYYRDKLRNVGYDAQDIVEKKYYSIDHPRTKEAEQFVKNMKEKRKSQKQEYQYYQTMKREEQQQKKMQEQENKEYAMMERKSKLKQYYESKLHQKLEGRQREKQKKQEYKEWMKAYKREIPIELEKQEEYKMKVVIPEMEERHKKLMTIKAERRPIDVEDILEHQMKYLDYKKDDRIRKKAELEMIEEEHEMHQQDQIDRLYKGKYRYIVLEKMLEERYPLESKDIEQSKKNRMVAYAQQIRIQQKQIQEMSNSMLQGQSVSNQKFTRRVRNMNGSLTVSGRGKHDDEAQNKLEIKSERVERKQSDDLDARGDGINNLHFVKGIVREQIAKAQNNKPIINFIDEIQVQKPKSFLEEQRERRENNQLKKRADHYATRETKETIQSNDQIASMKVNAKILEEKAKRGEAELKHASIADNMQRGNKIQGDYVDSIKAKINLINNFH